MTFALYVFCMAVSCACAFFLLRGYQRTRLRLLLYCGIGFAGIALNNILLVIDARVAADLSTWRSAPTLAGLMVFIWGLVGERER